MTASQALVLYKNQISFLEIEMLLQHVLNISRETLHLKAEVLVLSEDVVIQIQRSVRRILEGEPLAYILGFKDFYKSRFVVGPGVLVPRPESELVVDTVLKNKKNVNAIADFGAGSGCIGLSLQKEFLQSELLCVESSREAFGYLIQNAKGFANVQCVLERVEDLKMQSAFDVVVANPPYIAFDDPDVQPSVRRYEPEEALFSLDQGLSHFTDWTQKAFEVLKPRGIFVSEIGYDQGEKALEIAQKYFSNCQLIKDLNGLDRVIFGIKS